MKEEELLKKLREAFKLEAQERLANMSSGLLELEKASEQSTREPILEVVFREAHSLKGAARAVNFSDIETLCQSVESVFNAIRQEELQLSPELFDVLHSSIEAIEKFLACSDDEQSLLQAEKIAAVILQLEDLKLGSEKREEVCERKFEDEVNTDVDNQHEIHDEKERVNLYDKMVQENKQEDKQSDHEDDSGKNEEESLLKTPKISSSNKTPVTHTKTLSSETVRISTAKLDSLLLKAEEFVSLKLMLGQYVHNIQDAVDTFELWKKKWAQTDPELRAFRKQIQQENVPGVKEGNVASFARVFELFEWSQDRVNYLREHLRTFSKELKEGQLSLNKMVDDLLDDMKEVTMLPFSTLFNIFPRMVRDISREQGKDVELVLKGGEVEIDRRILEEMKDPLIHLLRNAIDHGLEDPEKRAEMQKPCSGIINLTVSQSEGNKVEINLSDDGGGIDLVKVKEKAIRKGFLSQGGADALKDEEIMLFIFRSEISTSPIITEISGRGIGLAIVQERVEQLGGVLSVETKLGVGTSFTMQLPVTQATFRGVLVRIGESLFILPASHVERVMRIEQEHIKTVENKATMPLDGWVLPFCDLGDVLKISRQKTPQKGNQSDSTALVTVMILGTGEKRVAFCIDEVIGEQEVLVKNLGKQLSRVPNIAGATILGTGKIVPALNVNDLLKSSHYTTHIPTDTKMNWREEEVGEKSVLVVEDSITSRVLLKNILEADGYLVHTAFDGRDAYTILKTERFDVVVSDVEMPRMNGFELTAKIRSDPRLAEVPVVLVTSLDSREDRERGIDVGADAYIVKSSFDQTNLLEVIRRLV